MPVAVPALSVTCNCEPVNWISCGAGGVAVYPRIVTLSVWRTAVAVVRLGPTTT